MSEQKENKENKKKQLYEELKELDTEIKNINAHLEKVDEQLSELNSSKIALNKLSELKKGDEIMVPFISGVYVKAELKETNKVLVNVGANVIVEKNPSEVIEILDAQTIELSKFRENLLENMKVLISRIEQIQKEFEE